MQSYKIIYQPEAEKALDRIYEKYTELGGANSAERIYNNIADRISHLSFIPYMGRAFLDSEEYRILNCGNYICLYRVSENFVFIADIVDGRTNYVKKFKTVIRVGK